MRCCRVSRSKRAANTTCRCPGAHRRVALELSLDAGCATLNLMTVHCAVRPRARALQQAMITALVGKAEEEVRVLLGDFNEWHVWNPTFRALREQFAVGPDAGDFPGRGTGTRAGSHG